MDQTKLSNESSKKASLSSSSSPTPSNSSSSAAADSYIGSFISLTSKYEIRYEGVLYFLHPQDSTLGLKNVKSYGTEGRRKDGPQIPPNDKVYEYILFRGHDIKDLQVKSSPPSQTEGSINNDPAIIQSHYAAGPSNSSRSVSSGGSSRSSDQEPPAFATGPYPGVLPTPHSKNHEGPFGLETSQNAQMSGMPRYWQGHDGASSSSPYAPQYPISSVSAAAPPAEHNHLQSPAMQMPMTAGLSNLFNVTAESLAVQDNLQAPSGLSNSLNAAAPVQSHVTSSLVHSNTRLTFDPYFNSPANLSSTSFVKASLSSHPAVPTANSISMPSLPSSSQNSNIVESQIANKGFNHGSVLPIQSWPHAISPAANSTSGPLLSHPPILLTPGQLSRPRPSALPSTMKPINGQNELGSVSSVSLFTTPAIQAPLLPASVKQSQYSSQFTEEFDFEAMNEKFKKDEVWGYLGKSKQKEIENDGQSLGNEEVHGVASNVDFKPAYNKDEFFDTISCHSLARGARKGQHRFSERLRLDTETFGNFQQRNYPVYGSHGFGRGENRGPYSWGRGYNYKNYGGRGCGGGDMRMGDNAIYKD